MILAAAVLAQLFACQAILASTAGPSTVAIQDIGHGTGHDIVCEAVQAVTATSTARTATPECRAPAAPTAALIALAIAALLLVGRVGPGGLPPGAPRRLVPGRHRLLAIGISRV